MENQENEFQENSWLNFKLAVTILVKIKHFQDVPVGRLSCMDVFLCSYIAGVAFLWFPHNPKWVSSGWSVFPKNLKTCMTGGRTFYFMYFWPSIQVVLLPSAQDAVAPL